MPATWTVLQHAPGDLRCSALNTDQFNDSIRADRKMTRAQFIGNNRAIDEALTPQYLGAIFDRICQNEIVMDSIDSSGGDGGARSRPPSSLYVSASASASGFLHLRLCLWFSASASASPSLPLHLPPAFTIDGS